MATRRRDQVRQVQDQSSLRPLVVVRCDAQTATVRGHSCFEIGRFIDMFHNPPKLRLLGWMHNHRRHFPVAAVVQAEFNFEIISMKCSVEDGWPLRLTAVPASSVARSIMDMNACASSFARPSPIVSSMSPTAVGGDFSRSSTLSVLDFNKPVAARVSGLILSDYREAIAFVLSNPLEQ
jgi:hypothetical protein